MTIPLISTFLFPMAPTTGGTNGGEQRSATKATQKRSPLTLKSRQNNKCSKVATTMINNKKAPITRDSESRLPRSNCEATTTLNTRMKNMPNSNVLGIFRILGEKEATIESVVIVRIITNSLSCPVMRRDNPAPMPKNRMEIASPKSERRKTRPCSNSPYCSTPCSRF